MIFQCTVYYSDIPIIFHTKSEFSLIVGKFALFAWQQRADYRFTV